MEPFSIEIAGIVITVHPMFASTREYCKRYLTDRPADLLVVVTREDLHFEQERLRIEALEQSIRPRKFPDPFLERSMILRKTAVYLLQRGTLLLHGSTVAVDGAAYLFTAPCGTGKSTHTRLWRRYFGDRAVMINDDKAFLRITDKEVLACGSPWSGKHGLDTNLSVPLKGICILDRGLANHISPISHEKASLVLRQQILATADDGEFCMAEKNLLVIMERVSLWEMCCNMEMEAAIISYTAMTSHLR